MYLPLSAANVLHSVMYSVFLIHRRTDLWGPTGASTSLFDILSIPISVVALEFDPDRFLDERLQKYVTHNPFIFMPFNAGPRICLGQQVSPVLHFYGSALTRNRGSSLRTTRHLTTWYACCRTSPPSAWPVRCNHPSRFPRKFGLQRQLRDRRETWIRSRWDCI